MFCLSSFLYDRYAIALLIKYKVYYNYFMKWNIMSAIICLKHKCTN